MTRKLLPVVLALLLAPSAARSDEVVLNGGTRLLGVVLSREDGGVRLLLPRGDEVLLLAADVAEVVVDPDAPQPGTYLRYRDPAEEGAGLEVAVTHLVHPEDGSRVDLVAMVHIGDSAFYEQVARLLESYDVVLYEGVKPEGTTPEDFQDSEGAEENAVRKLQRKVAGWFELAFQLDGIDYTRPNFVHADLSAEDFLRELGGEPAGEGEGGGEGEGAGEGELPGRLGAVMKQLDAMGPLLEAMFGQPGPTRTRFKRMFAQLLGSPNLEGMITAVLPDLSEVLLDKRNAVVVERVAKQREAGRRAVAVLYGGAHMAALEKSLAGEFGYVRAGGRWLLAWDVR